MEIKKLYTLRQFIKKMQTEKISDPEVVLFIIFAYTEFSCQTLSKEMCINRFTKPIRENYLKLNLQFFDEDLKTWQEAEDKIIFKNCAIDDNIIFFEGNVQIHVELLHTIDLETLSRMSKGEINLKNVKI